FPQGMRLIVPLDPEGLRRSTLLSPEGIERMLAEEHVPPRQETSDESMAAFVHRRFGEEALTVFGDSLLAGIHAASPQELSIQATFPEYVELERRFGSLIRGMREQAKMANASGKTGTMSSFVAPIGGVQELAETLARQLTGTVRTGARVCRIRGHAKVVLTSGEELEGSAILLTAPARVAGELLTEVAPEAGRLLRELQTVSTATVSLGFSAEEIGTELAGYGFVVPRSEDLHITACTWSSTKLAHRAPPGYVLVRVFFGGAGREQDIEAHDAQLIAWAREDLKRTLAVHATPVVTYIHRWRQASPVYAVGHREIVRTIRAAVPEWVLLAGAAYDGVGIPDCVRQGSEAARLLGGRGYNAAH
ncbi:MAG: protoporphyrinogen oxidase, partial [Chloroflexi bacterium]|nr:protoporphyrinogen oxidase [Chloroflexota bacterium]